jgi:hypothetical protein
MQAFGVWIWTYGRLDLCWGGEGWGIARSFQGEGISVERFLGIAGGVVVFIYELNYLHYAVLFHPRHTSR